MALNTIADASKFDFANPLCDLPDILKYNPQRDHMQQLDGIVHINLEDHTIVGFKQVRDDEFWISGHMPGYPLFPGVLMCEAAAQMISFYTKKLALFGKDLLGLGGLDSARFRYPVRPGDRLVMFGKGKKVSKRITTFDVEGYVGDKLCFECHVIGVPIPGHERVAEHISKAEPVAGSVAS